MSQSLKTYIANDDVISNTWTSIIDKYLLTLERNVNKLGVISPIYKGIPFVLECMINPTHTSQNYGILRFVFIDIYTKSFKEQIKSFIINQEHNYDLFKDILTCTSPEFIYYINNFINTTETTRRYVLNGLFALPIQSLYSDNVSQENFLKYCHNVTYNQNILRKKDIILEEDIIDYLKQENEYIGKEEDMLSESIFISEFFQNQSLLKNNFICTTQENFQWLSHFKNIEKLQSIEKYGLTTHLEDIQIVLPTYNNILKHIKFLYDTNQYVLQGVSLECDTSVEEEQMINIPFVSKTI
jgi:hypothetical protein